MRTTLLMVFVLTLVSLTVQQPPPPPPSTTTVRATTTKAATTRAATTTKAATTAAATTTKASNASTATSTTKPTTTYHPLITNWVKSTGVKYNGSYTDITGIYYDNSSVYITCNSLPSYSIGNWTGNPNKAAGKNYKLKLTMKPSANTGTKTSTRLGAIGVWKNGVAIYNAQDGYSYSNLDYWHRDAYLFEGGSFDKCGGHPDPSSTYHNHLNPTCMYNATDSTKHSPIIGWAFDSYPIYGPFGYSKANDSSSAIKRILPGYKLRNITTRTSFWDGTTLSSTYYGPAVSSTYYLGYFLEDYGWSSTNGDLDQYNGRWCVTPEYPNGTYAYFVPTNSNGTSVYPYSLAAKYYGVASISTSATFPTTVTKFFSYP